MDVKFKFDPKATVAALLLIASRVEMDKYLACKVLFLSDRLHLVRFGRAISGATYCALPDGPVPSEVLDILNYISGNRPTLREDWLREVEGHFTVESDHRYPLFRPNQAPDYEQLSSSDVAAIEDVLKDRAGKLDFNSLWDYTHSMAEYRRAKSREQESNNPRMRFEDFFEGNPDAVPGIFEEMVENAILTGECEATSECRT